MKPVNWLKLESAVSIAHGGSATIGVNILPDGSVDKDEITRLKPLFSDIKDKEEYTVNAEPVKDIAVIYSVASAFAQGVRTGDPAVNEFGPHGWHMALTDGHRQFTVLNDNNLGGLEDFKLIIVPNQTYLKEDVVESLSNYVKNGGKLLLSYESVLFNEHGERNDNFALSKAMGIDFAGYSPYSANYAKLNEALSRQIVSYPLLFTKKIVHATLNTAKTLATVVYPEAERTEDTFIWPLYCYNHPHKDSGKPMITVNDFGNGKCMYIAAPIGMEIEETNNSWLKQLMLNMVDYLLPERIIETDAPAGVEIILNHQHDKGRHIIHLINNYVVMGGRISLDEEGPVLGPVNIRCRLEKIGDVKKVYSPDNENISWTTNESWLKVEIPSIKTHSIIIIE